MKVTRSRGFSLIELMIAVAILGIITTMAVNSYQSSVRKARRADAKADLMELAQLLERNYTETNSFATNVSGNPVALAFTQSPQEGTAVYYNLQFSNDSNISPAAQSYDLKAVPNGPQTKDTRCMTLTLDETGTKGKTGNGTVTECW